MANNSLWHHVSGYERVGVVGRYNHQQAAPVALAINGSANYLGQGLGAAHGGLVISQLSLTATAPAGMLVALAGVLVAVWAFREA